VVLVWFSLFYVVTAVVPILLQVKRVLFCSTFFFFFFKGSVRTCSLDCGPLTTDSCQTPFVVSTPVKFSYKLSLKT